MRADGDSTVAIFPASQRSRGFKSVKADEYEADVRISR